MADDAVPRDRLIQPLGVASGVGGEVGCLLRGHLRGVHARDPFTLVEVPVPAVEAKPHVADVHGRSLRERAIG